MSTFTRSPVHPFTHSPFHPDVSTALLTPPNRLPSASLEDVVGPRAGTLATTEARPRTHINLAVTFMSSDGHFETLIMWFANFVLFSVQIRNDLALFARKSNNVFLFVPPCQGVCVGVSREYFDALVLFLCAGDVQLNPGPNTLDKTKPKSLDDALSALATSQQGQNSIFQKIK